MALTSSPVWSASLRAVEASSKLIFLSAPSRCSATIMTPFAIFHSSAS